MIIKFLTMYDQYYDRDTYSHSTKQECFPIGCVPSAAVAISVRGGVCIRQGVCLPGVCLVGVCLGGRVCLGGSVCPEGVVVSLGGVCLGGVVFSSLFIAFGNWGGGGDMRWPNLKSTKISP